MPIKPEYKVTLLGAGGVGKSALTLRIISGVFTPTYNPTVEDYYRHDTMVDGVGPCIVEMLDTAGTEQFASMRQLYISNSRAFALVYSIDDRASFDETLDIYQQIITGVSDPSNITVMLVANKCDLEHCREVETAEGKQAAREMMDNCLFLETSAMDGTNVQDFFVRLVGAMSGVVKTPGGGHKRARSTSVVAKASLIRGSLRLGGRRGRSCSQPDLSVCSTDSSTYHNFSLPMPIDLPDTVVGDSTKKRCSIM